jgi:hypothetical protein
MMLDIREARRAIDPLHLDFLTLVPDTFVPFISPRETTLSWTWLEGFGRLRADRSAHAARTSIGA